MPTLRLHLRAHPEPLPAVAGWLPSPEPLDWLAEMAAHDADRPCRVFPVPVSADNPAPGGAVLLPADPARPPRWGPRAQPLAWLAPRVLGPADARLHPALTAAEAADRFPAPLTFWHPGLGPVAFDDPAGLRPETLLGHPPAEEGAWGAAVPGPEPFPPLRMVGVERTVSLSDLVSGLGGDIGRDAGKPPGAEGGALGRIGGEAGRVLLGLAGGFLHGLSSVAPGGGKGEGWVDKLAQWGERQWEELRSRRQRELNRLMEMLDSNPEEGLRRALPLAGSDAGRGVAPPGARLAPRAGAWDWRGAGRAGPVDAWDVEDSTRAALATRYREAARRESAAGRHERAAYIHGQLLGDWGAAALELASAGLHRDAAQIWRQRLRDPARAARCLEEGGLLAEAIPLYLELRENEKAGDLYQRLGLEPEARAAWRTAAEHLKDPLKRARLLEDKLNDPEAALAALAESWPNHPEALEGLDHRFALLGRLGREAEARQLARALGDHRLATPPPAGVARLLARLGQGGATPALRDEARRAGVDMIGRMLAGRLLSGAAKSLLEVLPDFAPLDRLLARDAARQKLGVNPLRAPVAARPAVLRPAFTLPLPAGFMPVSLDACGPWLTVLGVQENQDGAAEHVLFAVSDRSVRVHERVAGESGKPPRLRHLQAAEADPREVLVHIAGDLLLTSLPACPDQLSLHNVLALARASPEELAFLRDDAEGLVVAWADSLVRVRRRLPLDVGKIPGPLTDVHLAARPDMFWLAGHGFLYGVVQGGQARVAGLAGEVHGLSVAPAGHPPHALVVAEREVMLAQVDNTLAEVEYVNLFHSGAQRPPVATFTRQGLAVAADATGGLLQEIGRKTRTVSEVIVPPRDGPPLAATPCDAGGFALLTPTALHFYD